MDKKIRLGDVATYINGYAFKPADRGNIGLPIIRIQDLTGNAYDLGFYDGEYPEKIEINDGDVLISWSASLGVYVWNRGKALLNQHIFKVAFDKVDVDRQYFVYAVRHKLTEMSSKTHGATMKHIVKKDFDDTEIPYPSIKQQVEIANVLDKAAFIIEARKKELDELDNLIKARFVALFGAPVINPKSWETAPLSALILNANNGMARRGKDADGSIVLRLVELQNGFIDYSAPNRICLNETEKKRYELVDNDFLFARVNGNPDYVGRCAVFKGIGEPVFHNDHIIRVHFDETKLNGCFTSVLLNSDYGKRQMREQIKTSAGQYTISQDGIGAIMTILPSMELQNQFAAFVKQTDKSKFAVQKALDEAQLLFESLMQKYFG